jgi:metal-dependent amidase/aminoacylase/carboxypeptidase family protein
VRTFTLETLDLIERRMEEISRHTAAAMSCEVDFEFRRLYPPTINHASEAAFCTEVMRDMVGAANVNPEVKPSTGAEDFSFMLLEKAGAYIWAGNGSGEHRDTGHGMGPCMLHNGSYDFNDELLPVGATYWTQLALRWLAQPAK